MATRFEILVCGENPVAARAAAEEALDEIERLEGLLSLFLATSEIRHVNARAAFEPVRISAPVFRLLQQARDLSVETDGAFDITVAPLMRCWGFAGGAGRLPESHEIKEARARVGFRWVDLDETSFSVRFAREGMALDLGGIGKGYALERAAEILREAGVGNALLHGGTSTVHAIGKPPNDPFWKIALEHPERTEPDGLDPAAATSRPERVLGIVTLENEALSVSAVSGKYFLASETKYGHVLDPRTGYPVQRALLAAVALPSATETDAFSTALLTLGEAGHEALLKLRPEMRTLLVSAGEDGNEPRVSARGIEPGGNQ